MRVDKNNGSLPLYLLTLGDKRDALLTALAKMSDEDKMSIEALANDLVSAMKANHPGVQFTKDSAIEVIAMLGIFMSKRKEKS